MKNQEERPLVTWGQGKKDSEKFVYWIGIFMLLVGLISWACEFILK